MNIFASYDRAFGKQIAALTGLLMANLVFAVLILAFFDEADPTTQMIVQMATIAFVSALSCLVLLRLNSSRKEAAEMFDNLAAQDKLTGLASRERFVSNLEQRLSDERASVPFALLMLDVDRFKELNAFLGYTIADQVLQQIANRLIRLTNYKEDAARVSADEFAFLVSYDGSGEGLEQELRKVFDALYKPYKGAKDPINLTLSVGVTLYPDDAIAAESLLQNAHFALERAQSIGTDQICCYDEVTDPQKLDEHFLSQDMERALQDGEFKLFYQPQISFETGKLCGYEALIRWHHKDRGHISPGIFIPIAEKNGLILRLSEFILKSACETASGWVNPVKVAVNLSPVQMQQSGIADHVSEILLETDLDPRLLELEVTESLFIDINDRVMSDLRRLQKKGISIALDDFGTGYSSLSYLTKFPFEKIKIDQSFVKNLSRDKGSMAIVSAVIGMAKSLDMKITAEGIEDEESHKMLRLAGCDVAQGYLFGKPRDLSIEPGEESNGEYKTQFAV